VRKWNSLDNAIKAAISLKPFKCTIKKLMFKTLLELGRYYNRFKVKSSVNHTRIRLGFSALKHHLYTHGIVATPTCQFYNNEEDETPLQYFLECPKHVACKISLGCGQLWIGSTLRSATHNQSLKIIRF